MALAATARPIAGAVATLGVSDRITFLRKTYAHLGGALIAFAVFTALMMKYATGLSLRLAMAGSGGFGSFVLVLGAFFLVSWLCQKLATSQTSRGLQYLGLGLGVVMWSVLAQPIIWFTIIKFRATGMALTDDALLSPQATKILGEAAILTIAIFLGLTLTVFYTKKDFTPMAGFLSIGLWALIGLGIASALFGFHMGAIYSGLVVALMAGYILVQTSQVMNYFPPTMYVAAALMLFGTVVTLFIHLLRILAESQRR